MNLYFCAYANSAHGGAIQKIPAPDSRYAAINFLAFQGWLELDATMPRMDVHVQNIEGTRCFAYRVRRGDLYDDAEPDFSCVYLEPVDRPLSPPHWPETPAWAESA